MGEPVDSWPSGAAAAGCCWGRGLSGDIAGPFDAGELDGSCESSDKPEGIAAPLAAGIGAALGDEAAEPFARGWMGIAPEGPLSVPDSAAPTSADRSLAEINLPMFG